MANVIPDPEEVETAINYLQTTSESDIIADIHALYQQPRATTRDDVIYLHM